MPQGITNAPSAFQRLMKKCMGDIHLREVLVFLDDLIVFSKTLEEHEVRLTNVLNRLRENGLKLSPFIKLQYVTWDTGVSKWSGN